MSSVNPPGGLNLTLAILALLSAALSIVGFIAHYIPRHQYGDFCSILLEINDIFADDDWLSLLPPDQRSRLYRRYCRHVHYALLSSSFVGWWLNNLNVGISYSISADLESLCYLVSVPSYVLVFYVRTALRLQSLRRSASQLKIELIVSLPARQTSCEQDDWFIVFL